MAMAGCQRLVLDKNVEIDNGTPGLEINKKMMHLTELEWRTKADCVLFCGPQSAPFSFPLSLLSREFCGPTRLIPLIHCLTNSFFPLSFLLFLSPPPLSYLLHWTSAVFLTLVLFAVLPVAGEAGMEVWNQSREPEDRQATDSTEREEVNQCCSLFSFASWLLLLTANSNRC